LERLVARGLTLLVWVSVLLSLSNLLPVFHLWQEININLGCYYLAAHVLTLALLSGSWAGQMRLRRTLRVTLAILCIFYGTYLYRFYMPVSGAPLTRCGEGEKCALLRVLFAHFPQLDAAQEALLSLVCEEQPVLVALVGAPQSLPEYLQRFPHQVRSAENLTFSSMRPLSGKGRVSLGEDMPEVLMSTLEVSEGRTLEMTLLDGFPLEDGALLKNKLLTRRLLTNLKHNDHEGLLFASLHVTPFSNYYRPFVWAAKFQNASNGFGLWYTWDGRSYFKRLSVDHVLARGYLNVRRYETRMLPGEAHLPVVVEFETPLSVTTPWHMPWDE
jgi:hypothetical protein